MRRTALVVAAVIGMLGLTGAANAVPAPTQNYKVTATDPKNGATIEVPNGDRLLLALTACESCGNRWKILAQPDPTVMAYDKQLSSVRKGTCKSPCVGGYVYERFRFFSKAVGTATVKLGYFVQASTKPSKTLTLKLYVVS